MSEATGKKGLFGVDWLTADVLTLLVDALFAGIGQIVKMTKTTKDDDVFNAIAKFFSGILPGLATLIVTQAVKGATGDDINTVLGIIENASGKLPLAPSTLALSDPDQSEVGAANPGGHNQVKESIANFVEKIKAGLQKKRTTVPA